MKTFSLRRFWPVVLVASFWGVICLANVFNLIQKQESRLHLPATDFRTLYAASVAVGDNRWDLLYPPALLEKTPWSPISPELGDKLSVRGVSGFVFAWLYPPTAAILFAPLSILQFPYAWRLWMILNWLTFTVLMIYMESEMNENEGLPVLLSEFGFPVGIAIRLSNGFLLITCVLLYVRYATVRHGDLGALLFCITFFLFQISNNVSWTHYRVHLIAFVPTVLSCCRNQKWLAQLAFTGFVVNFLPIRNFLLALTHTPFDQAPPLVANFGVVCYLFLLVVMGVILHIRSNHTIIHDA